MLNAFYLFLLEILSFYYTVYFLLSSFSTLKISLVNLIISTTVDNKVLKLIFHLTEYLVVDAKDFHVIVIFSRFLFFIFNFYKVALAFNLPLVDYLNVNDKVFFHLNLDI